MAKLDIVLMGGRLTYSVSSTARETQTEIGNYRQIYFLFHLRFVSTMEMENVFTFNDCLSVVSLENDGKNSHSTQQIQF